MDTPLSPQTLDFLFENRLHDSRDWFHQHQAQYRDLVLAPLRQLVQELTPAMLELDGDFVTEPRVDRTICRIWRDTRYTKDPSLYRDHMWVIFKRGGKMHGSDYPGLYVEVNGGGIEYGCGFYHAPTPYMATLRALVLAGDPAFRAADQAYRGQDTFRMEGECFRRPRYGHRTPEEQDWLERRNISFHAACHDFATVFSPALPRFLEGELRKLFPVYRFLLRAAQETLRAETQRELAQR